MGSWKGVITEDRDILPGDERRSGDAGCVWLAVSYGMDGGVRVTCERQSIPHPNIARICRQYGHECILYVHMQFSISSVCFLNSQNNGVLQYSTKALQVGTCSWLGIWQQSTRLGQHSIKTNPKYLRVLSSS